MQADGAMGIRFLLAVFLPLAAAHSNLIKPKPRNAIDSELSEWKDGNAPYMWVPNVGKVTTRSGCVPHTSARPSWPAPAQAARARPSWPAPTDFRPACIQAGAPCACRNGSDVCASAQTCLWFSVGCTIGCQQCVTPALPPTLTSPPARGHPLQRTASRHMTQSDAAVARR